jgi:hypothetical protein
MKPPARVETCLGCRLPSPCNPSDHAKEIEKSRAMYARNRDRRGRIEAKRGGWVSEVRR